jgi:hypothetical protein
MACVLPYKEESVPETKKFQRYAEQGPETCGARKDGLTCYLDSIHVEFSKHVHRAFDGALIPFEIEEEE